MKFYQATLCICACWWADVGVTLHPYGSSIITSQRQAFCSQSYVFNVLQCHLVLRMSTENQAVSLPLPSISRLVSLLWFFSENFKPKEIYNCYKHFQGKHSFYTSLLRKWENTPLEKTFSRQFAVNCTLTRPESRTKFTLFLETAILCTLSAYPK